MRPPRPRIARWTIAALAVLLLVLGAVALNVRVLTHEEVEPAGSLSPVLDSQPDASGTRTQPQPSTAPGDPATTPRRADTDRAAREDRRRAAERAAQRAAEDAADAAEDAAEDRADAQEDRADEDRSGSDEREPEDD